MKQPTYALDLDRTPSPELRDAIASMALELARDAWGEDVARGLAELREQRYGSGARGGV